MDMSPNDIDLQEVQEDLCRIWGVTDVHDLHCWYLAFGEKAMSCHIRVNADSAVSVCSRNVLEKANAVLRTYGIKHTTIQIEAHDHKVTNLSSVRNQTAFCVNHQLE